MKAVVAAFNQEKALVGAFSVITNLRMELLEALVVTTRNWFYNYKRSVMRLEDTDKSLEIVEGDGVGQQVVLKSVF